MRISMDISAIKFTCSVGLCRIVALALTTGNKCIHAPALRTQPRHGRWQSRPTDCRGPSAQTTPCHQATEQLGQPRSKGTVGAFCAVWGIAVDSRVGYRTVLEKWKRRARSHGASPYLGVWCMDGLRRKVRGCLDALSHERWNIHSELPTTIAFDQLTKTRAQARHKQ